MPRYHNINGEMVQFTADEETARDAEEKAWADAADTRAAVAVREERDALLAATDWMGNSDVTMSSAWKTYRKALRDITEDYNSLDDVKWPTKP